MTALIYALPGATHIANVSMLYLLVVIAAAVRFGSGPAVAASLLAFLTFNWFFVHPKSTLRVHEPAEWIALCVFLITAVVTGQMTALLQARAEEARQRERETAVLAEVSWAIASQLNRDRALAEVLRRLEEVIGPEAAGVFLPGLGDPLEVAVWHARGEDPPPDLKGGPLASAACRVLESGKAAGWRDLDHRREASGTAQSADVYLPLTLEQRVLGVLYLRFGKERVISPQERRVVQSLVSQAAVVLERDRLAQAELKALALAEADRLKTALLSMVSHDFRSPLASIKASVTGLLQEGAPWDPDTQRELLQGIDHETDRLNRMVGNILALSRLEADAWRPQREATPFAELVGAALDSFTAEDNRRIRVALDPEVADVWVDAVQIVQVFRNLVDNALKYSPAGSAVELRARHVGEELVIEVLDRGIGLSAGDQERIFEPFYRAPELQEGALPGVGIGLAVCRGLVEAHQGRLTAQNREGGGSVFRMALPLAGADCGGAA